MEVKIEVISNLYSIVRGSFSSIVRMIQEDFGTTSSSAPTSIYRWSKKTNQSGKQH
ncbi:unnamed protein product [Nesidiocoris tenuis]|uniref:Uncharacterized protein n=1 Tax=Nesidiocoris tenuis TaxID=355587 RepID=A0A6H5HNI5_9HEMI|nr:unnamed protein product [Nesidiocoris tenuis]